MIWLYDSGCYHFFFPFVGHLGFPNSNRLCENNPAIKIQNTLVYTFPQTCKGRSWNTWEVLDPQLNFPRPNIVQVLYFIEYLQFESFV